MLARKGNKAPEERMRQPIKPACILGLLATASAILSAQSMSLFQVKLIEQGNSRLIATSNYNYALASPKLLTKGWQTVSVNGDQVYVTLASNGQQQVLSRAAMTPADVQFIESLRDEFSNTNNGYTHIASMDGTSYGGISHYMTDANNFSVSRSDFPFNWSRVFFNGNTLTFVFRNGDVRMMPQSSLSAEELEAVNRIRADTQEMQRLQAQQMSYTMQHSMDMVSNVFNNIMGSLPQPPSYQSSVGNMFGNNFPFGPNNSPFSASNGWPFGGVGAVAYATRR